MIGVMDKIICAKCQQPKEESSFGSDKIRKNGKRSWCKDCASSYMRAYRRKRFIMNPERERAKKKQYREAYRASTKGGLNHRISKLIRKSLREGKHGWCWESLVGFTASDLKKHLEKQFTQGMSWEKFMAGEIHIDHKIPRKVFNFESSSDIDFKRCWDLRNLQPLWAADNMKKNDRFDGHFQPSLLMREV